MRFRFNQVAISLCVLGITTSIFAQPVLVKKQQKIEEYQLSNGFRVILAPNDKENKVYMNTVYLTGSLNDPEGQGGLAHLLEHLAFKGTTNVPDKEFQRQLDQHTLSNNASTSYYATQYINLIRPEQKSINALIHLEAERMDKLVLQEKFVPAEIAIVKREREVRMDQPFAVLMDKVWKSLYGNQYFGRLPIGDLDELQSIDMHALNTFYKTWYAPNNAVMIVTGKFDQAEVLKQIDHQFGHIPARAVPQQRQVPPLDTKNIKQRQFLVEKGSDLAKFNIYLNGPDQTMRTVLATSPALYTLQPSGHLYQNMVETGIATQVLASSYLDRNFNVVFMGAIFSPTADENKVASTLIDRVEQNKKFNESELKRVKQLIQNYQEGMFANAAAVGEMLSDYVVSHQGNWTQYFIDQQQLNNLSVAQVNQYLNQFFQAQNRIEGDIKPTPEAQKQALTQQQSSFEKTLDQTGQPAEPLKDISTYQREIAQNVILSKQHLLKAEQNIQRGELANGMKYALFPTATRDDKIYASIHVDFGRPQTLANKAELIDLTAYLLLRGSNQYNLQDIADKSIEANGSASATSSQNGMNIKIVAKKDQFDDFFKLIIDIMKNPKFEQRQFDLIKQQTLSGLDRPYTEPTVVAAMTLSRQLERYQPGDLRYHFEPEWVKKQINAASNQQVKQFYQQFFAMNHAQIAITGDFNANSMKKFLSQEFENWNGQEDYERLDSPYQEYAAQKIHALAEQREFGSYAAVMTFPVGEDHPDMPAMTVLRNILGESQLSSRLAKQLREKKALVYGFSSTIHFNDHQDSGALTIDAQYTAGKASEVSQSVHHVLYDLIQNGVTEQEIAAAKADIMKKRVTALEDERRVHTMLIPQLKLNRDLLFREQRDQAIARLTKADIDTVIRKYIKLDHLVEVMADQYGVAQS